MPARNVGSDFYHAFRFHIKMMDAASNGDNSLGSPDAGFSACTTPEASVESVEYREGQYVYTRKQAGVPSMTDITVSRGVAKGDSQFWKWMKVCMEGDGAYRNNMIIRHYHRDAALKGTSTSPNPQFVPSAATSFREYQIFEAFPIRHKVASDLDGTASEISIQEIDFAYEYFFVNTTSEGAASGIAVGV